MNSSLEHFVENPRERLALELSVCVDDTSFAHHPHFSSSHSQTTTTTTTTTNMTTTTSMTMTTVFSYSHFFYLILHIISWQFRSFHYFFLFRPDDILHYPPTSNWHWFASNIVNDDNVIVFFVWVIVKVLICQDDISMCSLEWGRGS